MTVLEMKHIRKEFPGVVALDDVSIDLMPGEVLGLVGENGAGKSTLMKILSGVYPHHSYEGEIHVGGERYDVSGPVQAEKSGIAMIYQEVSLHLDLSVAENLMLGQWQRRGPLVNWGKTNQEAQRVLDQIQLSVSPDVKVRRLSTSQQQLIAIGRALYRRPRLLIMDEPTSSLTESETQTLFEIIDSLKKTGIGIILISHKIQEVMKRTDRIVVLRDGRVVGRHVTTQTSAEEIINETVGRRIEQMYPPKGNTPGDELFRVERYIVAHPINREKNILEDVSFSLKRGEVLGIAGLVGAGRSELLNALFGLGGYVSGDVLIEGRAMRNHSAREAIENRFALITDDRKLNGFVGVLNIKENAVMASYRGVSRMGWINAGEEQRLAREQADQFSIKAPSLTTIMNTLSGGNQQKVVLAKWLMTQPQILLLDEPTRGVDVGTKNELYKMIDSFACNGMSCIVVSSEMPELMAMANRIIVLAGGRVCGELEREAFDEEKLMRLAMG